jgi:hypothetical protein
LATNKSAQIKALVMTTFSRNSRVLRYRQEQ